MSKTARMSPCPNRQVLEDAPKCFADTTKRQEYFHLYSADIALHGYQGLEPGLESVKLFYSSFWDVFPMQKWRGGIDIRFERGRHPRN
jgi:hypothetical protein